MQPKALNGLTVALLLVGGLALGGCASAEGRDASSRAASRPAPPVQELVIADAARTQGGAAGAGETRAAAPAAAQDPGTAESLDKLAAEMAQAVAARSGDKTVAMIWPLEVNRQELQPAAVVFEDVLLMRLAAAKTQPAVEWTSRRLVEKSLQEIAESRRAIYKEDTLPKIGEIAAARYAVHGTLTVQMESATTTRVHVEAKVVDIEKATAGGARVEGDLVIEGPPSAEMRGSVGRSLRPLTPLDDVGRLVRVGGLGEKMAAADRAYDLGDFDGAVKLYGEAEDVARTLQPGPEHAMLYYRLGNLYNLHLKRPDDALKYYEKALEVDAKHHLSWNNRGQILLERDECDKARDCFSRALAAQPDFVIGRYNRALAVLKSGTDDRAALQDALKDFEAAAAAAPSAYETGRGVEGKAKIERAKEYAEFAREKIEWAGKDPAEAALRKSLRGVLDAVERNYGTLYAERFVRLMVAWAGKGKATALAPGKQLGIEMALLGLKDGKGDILTVREGGVLRSGRDLFKVVCRARTPCHLYAWDVDSTGKVCPLFPVSVPSTQLPANPLAPGVLVEIPGGRNWFFLDDNVGVENVMFLVSVEPRADVEEALRYFAKCAYEEEARGASIVELEKPDGLSEEAAGGRKFATGQSIGEKVRSDTGITTRGVGGTAQGDPTQVIRPGPDGVAAAFNPVLYTANETEMTARFWFRHVGKGE